MRFGFFRVSIGVVVALAAVYGTCLAAATPGIETTPIPLTAKPDWSSMKFLVGTWHCSSKSSRRPSPFVSTLTTSADPTGYWLVTKTTGQKTSWAAAINSTDSVTYDPAAHRWADVYTDDQGGYDVTFSPGWKANTITWTDPLFVPGPDVIAVTPLTQVKVNDTKLTAHSTFTEKSGRINTLNTVCTKV